MIDFAEIIAQFIWSDCNGNTAMQLHPGPWQCVLFLIPRSFHDGGALNYSTAPPSVKDNTNFQRRLLYIGIKNTEHWPNLTKYIALIDHALHVLCVPMIPQQLAAGPA
jgi:hypothetical protein